ncbi:hypothetical protein [Neobacillus mesonae]|uniref:Replication initiator A N-terminal domain-containing protein n=1 Tax=Neobacillus mesonae TaxID=1193713 RepID=A0A3Q9QT81_9BACI|nr:hypothetical protein [Neobacillus mesonae]AZU60104.1 hypothetical protein CHR53_01825 [Neobacillus mesonae]
MTKKYFTKAYVDMLNDKEKQTGTFFTPPKVVIRGDKYRETLSPTEKLLYNEFYDMSKKAAHDNKVDKKGFVYVEVSYIFLAVAIGVSDSTVQRILSNKSNPLYTLGLLQVKERKDKSTSQYYVMAPEYEGHDEIFLTGDGATPAMKAKAQELSAKKNRKSISKRKTENEQLEDERVFDTKADTAEFEIIEKEIADSTPDIDLDPTELEVVAEEKPDKQMYFNVYDDEDRTGRFDAHFNIEQNGKVVSSWTLAEFVKNMKLDIDYKRHQKTVLNEIMAVIGNQYQIRYKDGA